MRMRIEVEKWQLLRLFLRRRRQSPIGVGASKRGRGDCGNLISCAGRVPTSFSLNLTKPAGYRATLESKRDANRD